MNMITGGGDDNQPDPTADLIKQQVEQIFGEHLLKIAHVEVFWGRRRSERKYHTNPAIDQPKQIDSTVATLQATMQATRPQPSKKKPTRKGKQGKGTPPPNKGDN